MKEKLELPNMKMPPTHVNIDGIFLDVLSPKYNFIDFEAWSSSKMDLKGILGPDNLWPFDVLDLNHNELDLKKHEEEFFSGEAYAYTVLCKSTRICIGCLYIRPSQNLLYECQAIYWFRNSCKKTYEPKFQHFLENWLNKEWGFQKIAFPGRTLTWKNYLQTMN